MPFLTGDELLAKVQQLGDISKTELVRGCGYYSIDKNGKEKLNFTAFYEALLRARGVKFDADLAGESLENTRVPWTGACYFILDGFCNGAFPVNGIESICKDDWYFELINFIKAGQTEKAITLAESKFSAEYAIENLDLFEECGIRFVHTLSIGLADPFVEKVNGQDVALFRWIGAQFLMEGPVRIVHSWTNTLEDGSKIFSEEKFDEWLGDDGYLQDGCCYFLGDCCYDLEGFGENGCTIDEDSVIKGLNHIRGISDIETTCGPGTSVDDELLLERVSSARPTASYLSASRESTSIYVGRNDALLLPKKYLEPIGLKPGEKAFISVDGNSIFVTPNPHDNQISETFVLPSGNISISTDILESIFVSIQPGDEFFLDVGPEKISLTIIPA